MLRVIGLYVILAPVFGAVIIFLGGCADVRANPACIGGCTYVEGAR